MITAGIRVLVRTRKDPDHWEIGMCMSEGNGTGPVVVLARHHLDQMFVVNPIDVKERADPQHEPLLTLEHLAALRETVKLHREGHHALNPRGALEALETLLAAYEAP